MARIDAHQHFWRYDPVRDAWIGPDMQAIRKDFLPADLLPLLQAQGMDGCIAVQAEQAERENDFLLSLAETNDCIKGIVGWVDLRNPGVKERLAHYSGVSIMKGFRHILQGEKDRAMMLQPDFRNGIGELRNYGFTYDLLILPDQLGFARELAQDFPDQPFILDHIAKPDIRRGSIVSWARDLQQLAACPNVYCKVSGMVTEADWTHWTKADIYPYLDYVLEDFGAERLLWGSDWPVCLVAGRYGQVLALVQDYFASCSPAEQANIFGGNAERIYNL